MTVLALPVLHDADTAALERLRRHLEEARGAVPPNTARALRGRLRGFARWCAARQLRALPASAETIVSYLAEHGELRAVATLGSDLWAIGWLHRAADLADPTTSHAVRAAHRLLLLARGRRQRQAAPLTFDRLQLLLQGIEQDARGIRDAAMLRLLYDTLCRRSALVQIQVEDIERREDGSGIVLLRRGKTDQAGDGRMKYLRPETMSAIAAWLDVAAIGEGPLFQALDRRGRRSGKPLTDRSVALIVKARAAAAGLDPAGFSGHSTRIGATQDMIAADIDLAAIMQAADWTTPRMPMRYGEKLLPARGAAALLAAKQRGG